MATKHLKNTNLVDDVRQYLETLEDAKLEYDRADELLLEISRKWRKSRKILPENGKFLLVDGIKYELVDQYKGQSKVWGHGSVRKWDIRPLKKGKLAA